MLIFVMDVMLLFNVLFIMGLFWLHWKKTKGFFSNREKLSPFECGFDPSKVSRLPFSLRFFLLLVFFLIFDMELILLLELPLLFNLYWSKIWFYIYMFLFMLFLGFIEEWRRGALDWKI